MDMRICIFAPDKNLIRQYLQDEEIARDFGAYYQLLRKNIVRITGFLKFLRIPFDESVAESPDAGSPCPNR